MKQISNFFKFLSMKTDTVVTVAVATIFALVLSSCAPIAENERLPPLQPGYGRIIVDVSKVGGRAVTDADKESAEYKIYFNGTLSKTGTHGVFPVGSTVNIRVEGYRQGTAEQIGIGTESHTMKYGTNRVPVTLRPVGGYYKVSYKYGDALLSGTYSGITTDRTYYKGGEDEVTAFSEDIVTWQHGTLSSWTYYDENGSAQTVDVSSDWKFTMPSADTTLTAVWTRNKYQINYYENAPSNSTGVATITWGSDNPTLQPTEVTALDTASTFNGQSPTSAQFDSKDWTFIGWNTQADGSGIKYSAGQTITTQMIGDIKLYAQWSDKNVWTVTYAKGNTQATNITNWRDSENVVSGNEILLPELEAKGYTFDGWQIDGEINNKGGGTSYTPTQSVTATAQWTLDTYTLSYNYAGHGSEDVAGDKEFNVESQTLNFPTVTNETGYTFSYWSVNGTDVTSYTGSQLLDMVTSGKSLEVTAVYTLKPYKIQFNAGTDGSGTQTAQDFTIESTDELPPKDEVTFTEPQYKDFSHWSLSEAGNAVTLIDIIDAIKSGTQGVSSDTITIYAVWKDKSYTVIYSWGDGVSGVTDNATNTNAVLPTQDDVTYGKTFTVQLPSVTRAGYKFLGWSEADGQTVATYDTSKTTSGAVAGDVTLYAVWEAIDINVTLNAGSGSGTDSQTVTFKLTDTQDPLPTFTYFSNTGYSLAGWAYTNGGGAATFDALKAAIASKDAPLSGAGKDEITLYAVWKTIPYREFADAQEGDVICANVKVLSASEITTTELQAQTVAIVWKVGQNSSRQHTVWGIGKHISSSGKAWCKSTAQGATTIEPLKEPNYTDGSTGLSKFQNYEKVTDTGTESLKTNYPAWDYACNYGTNTATNADIPLEMQSSWYFPSKQDLTEVYEKKALVEAGLERAGASVTTLDKKYLSSTQNESSQSSVYVIDFSTGSWESGLKILNTSAVMAMRQFTLENMGYTTSSSGEIMRLPVVGDAVMKDGTFKSITDPDLVQSDVIAIVYKVDNYSKTLQAIGKEHSQKAWCLETADGYARIAGLVCEVSNNGYSLTMSGPGAGSSASAWSSLMSAGLSDIDKEENYPAWYYCRNYGKTLGLSSELQADWYLPSPSDIYTIAIANSDGVIETSLEKAGGDKFESNTYWTAGQYGRGNLPIGDTDTTKPALADTHNLSGTSSMSEKQNVLYVRAMRTFTW